MINITDDCDNTVNCTNIETINIILPSVILTIPYDLSVLCLIG